MMPSPSVVAGVADVADPGLREAFAIPNPCDARNYLRGRPGSTTSTTPATILADAMHACPWRRCNDPEPVIESASVLRSVAMPSPFPGMDPYLEDAGLWPDVHHELISTARHILTESGCDRSIQCG